MGLLWVKENIHAFGGNPDNLTVFGESAGSVSVDMLSVMFAKEKLVRRIGGKTRKSSVWLTSKLVETI